MRNSTKLATSNAFHREKLFKGAGYKALSKRCCLSAVSDLFVAQLQDYLGPGAGSGMNVPGILDSNWQWCLTAGLLTPELTRKIAGAAKLYGRGRKAEPAEPVINKPE